MTFLFSARFTVLCVSFAACTAAACAESLSPVMELGAWKNPTVLIQHLGIDEKAASENDLASEIRTALKALGVAFPQGSEIVYDQKTRILAVRNTREALDLIATTSQGCSLSFPVQNLALEIQIIECPASEADKHWKENTAIDLHTLAQSGAKSIASVTNLARSGNKFTATVSNTQFHAEMEGTPSVSPEADKVDLEIKGQIKWTDTNSHPALAISGAYSAPWDTPFLLKARPAPNAQGKTLVAFGILSLFDAGGSHLATTRPPQTSTLQNE